MTVPTIALKTSVRQYAKLVELGNTVAAGLIDNSNFITPAVPVVILQMAVSDLSNQIAIWGPKHNRGSHESLITLKRMAGTLHQLLKAEAGYVQTTAAINAGGDYGLMAQIITTSGFALKASGSSQGALNKVQNLQFMASPALNRNQVKMVWDRPLEVTSPENVKCSNVYRSATTEFADAVAIDTVTKNEFIDTNDTGATVTWSYFVAAVGAAGEGAISEPITITLLSA